MPLISDEFGITTSAFSRGPVRLCCQGKARVDAARKALADAQQALRRAQAKARNMKRERAALDAELRRRRQAVAEADAKFGRLREALSPDASG